MRLYSTAYLAYAVQIPDTDIDAVKTTVKAIDGVSYLTCGRFENQQTYLTTKTFSAEAGEPTTLTAPLPTNERNTWNHALTTAATALGHTNIPAPGWLLIADLDN